VRQINIGMVKINDIEIGGTVSVNQSVQKGFHNTTKKNQGFGENASDGSVFEVVNGSLDQDVVDNNLIAKSNLNKRKGTY
jgi:hypothetical protein